MKDKNGSNITPVTDSEISKLLREEAVARGLKLPETVEEFKIFEDTFCNELKASGRKRPSLKKMLELAKKIENSGEMILKEAPAQEANERYQMAARNGKTVPADIEALLDEAIEKAKRK